MRFIFSLLFALSFLFAGPAFSFVIFTESVKFWADSEVTYDYNFDKCPYDESDMLAVFEYGLNQWNDIPGSRLKLILGTKTTKTAGNVFANYTVKANPLLSCVDDLTTIMPSLTETTRAAVPYAGFGTFFYDSSMATTTGYAVVNVDVSSAGGKSMAEMKKNGASFWGLKNLTAHEIGHTLGFNHSGDSESVMNYTGKEVLSMDDEDGVRYFYGVGDGKMQFVGCSRISDNGNFGTSKVVLALFFCPLFLLLRRRKINP